MFSQLLANLQLNSRLNTLIFAAGLVALMPFAACAQVGASTGSNAGPLTCIASAAGTPQSRTEGRAELLTDITITCTGGPEYTLGSETPTTDITVSVWPAPSVTGSPSDAAGNVSEALLFIDEPGSSSPTGAIGNFGPHAPQILCLQGASGCPTYVGADGSGNYRVASSAAPVSPGFAADGQAANIYRGVTGSAGSNKVTFYGVPMLPPVKVGVARVFHIANLNVPTGGFVSVSDIHSTINQTLGVIPTNRVTPLSYEDLYRYSLAEQSHVVGTSTSWYNPLWQYRKAITIPHGQISGASALLTFPVLVSLTDPNLKSFSQANGNDILFTAGDGITKLNHEIESYNTATGQLIAWVQLPSLSPVTDTGFYMYYGNTGATDQSNRTAVWSKYAGAWHFPSGATLTANDSTANANNAFSTGGSLAAIGQIGDGVSLATGNLIQIPESSSLDFGANSFSYSLWFKTSAGGNGAPLFTKQKAKGWRLIYSTGGDNKLQARLSDGTTQVNSAESAVVNNGAWHYVVITVDRGAAKLMHLYLDGAEVGAGSSIGSVAGSITDPTAEVDIDGVQGIAGGFVGQADEARIIDNTDFSADWIKTEYRNQSVPASFYSLAAQESYAATPVIASFSASPASISSGQSTMLSWTTSGAASFSIDQGLGAVTGASVSVSPGASTTYTLTATNAAGSTTAQAPVTVVGNSLPVISSLTASPSAIAPGQAAMLRWTVSGTPAPAISINNGVGAVSGTSVSVSPAANTTYTLTATNSIGSATTQATVTLNLAPAAPAIAFYGSSNYIIRPGQSSNLLWTITGSPAPTISIDNGVGAVTGTSKSVSPAQTTTYNITATNSSGTATWATTVMVTTTAIPTLNQSYSSLMSARQYDMFYSSAATNPQTNPIVVYLHGGGWTGGDKSSAWIAGFDALIAQGYTVYNIDYTLASAGNASTQWPAQAQDIKCFLSYLAGGHGVGDPNKISIWGFSAGAHLALMAALTDKSQFSNSCEWNSGNYTIKSVVGSSTPVDLGTLYTTTLPIAGYPSGAQPNLVTLLGYVPATNPAGALAASPIAYVSASSPAVFVESGSADVLVPPGQSQELATAFANIGVTIQRRVFNGFDHTLDLNLSNGLSVPPVVAFIAATNPPGQADSNQPPSVSAGANQTITLPASSVVLTGSAMDDGLPNPPRALTYIWTQVSGPAATAILSATSVSTQISGLSIAGSYVFQLTASDSQLSGSSAVTVIVKPGPDTTPPTLTFTVRDSRGQSIGSNTTVSGSLTVTLSAGDPTVANQVMAGVTGINLKLDGGVVATSNGTSLSYTLNTQSLLNSNHTLVGSATDGAGNAAISGIFQLSQIGFLSGWQ